MNERCETMARALEDTGDYRILRRMQPRTVFNTHVSEVVPLTGLVLDTETTGLDTAGDDIIELGAIKFNFQTDGTIINVVEEFQRFREPLLPITAEITEITGITDEMVAGHKIADEEIAALLDGVVLVIAHNASFDRKMVERHWRGFDQIRWGCSLEEIDWKAEGCDSTKLGHLLAGAGLFHDGHRAVEDCRATLEVLNRPMKAGGNALGQLLQNARLTTVRIWATNAPFAKKDALKARGYRWSDGAEMAHKAWWIDVAEGEAYTAEMTFLEQEIYGYPANLPTRRLNALSRYSVRAA